MDVVVSPDGWLSWPGHRVRCALGRGGVRADKREGDGATPAGTFAVRRLLFRPDRGPTPTTALPTTALSAAALTPAHGWCDDPAHADYNREVRLPHPARCESLWRDDGVYDLIVVLGHNDAPAVPGLGSAIFLHLARDAYAPTEGCVALARDDLVALLAVLAPGDSLCIGAP